MLRRVILRITTILRAGIDMYLIGQKPVRRAKRYGAFTLVELLAVVEVMLIILRLTLPSLDGLFGGEAEVMARTQVVGEFNRARQMALERGTPG